MVSTGETEGRCFFILSPGSGVREEVDALRSGTIVRVAGSYVPGFRPPEAGWRAFGEGGAGSLGVSRGFDLNVRVAGSNTMVESELSYDVP